MNWLFPGFLAGGLLIGLPVLLHFLRSKPKTIVPFPTLRFLGESALQDTKKHRLRRWLTLLLRCLIIALLAAAFARPFWINAAAAHHRAVVVAIDNSMSMQASGRWETAKAWALQQLAELETGDQAGLLLMQPTPSWLAPMTDDLGRVRAMLQSVEPGFTRTHYDPALRLAGETLAAHPARTKTLVWMADEQQLGWTGADFAQALPPGVQMRTAEIAPTPKRQAAVVALRFSTNGRAGVTATVRLFSPLHETRQIRVLAGQQVLVQQPAVLHAGDNEIALPFPWPAACDGVRVTLDADDLPADDTAWIAAKGALSGGVLLDSVGDADFLAHALLSTQKLGDQGLKADALPDAEWPGDAVVIARAANTFRSPRIEPLNRFVEAGGALWIFANGSPEQIAWLQQRGVAMTERATPESAWHLRDWDSEHPALAAFAGQSLLPLLDVDFNRGYDLVGEDLVPIATWPDGKIALAEWTGAGRRVLLAGFAIDREATDWPARPSFVPFVHQAVRWLGSFAAAKADWRVDDSIPVPGRGQWRALDSANPAPPARSVEGSARADLPGLYEFTAPGVRKIFAVNIHPEESDLTPWPDAAQLAALGKNEATAPPVATETTATLLSDETAENQQRLWWWVLALGAAALFAELALANRTAM